LSVFVDTSVWFAAAVARDRENARAKSILASTRDLLTSDHILVETWLLLNSRYHRDVAERFLDNILRSGVSLEMVTTADLIAARAIGVAYPDQDFSIIDRTSFAVMERLGLTQVASFDDHFAIYRYGRNRDKAFEVIRHGHSAAFTLFHRAILERRQVVCRYKGQRRELCPHILGHTKGAEVVLAYQFGGGSAGGLPPKGEWRCLYLSQIQDIELREGRWHSGSQHRTRQKCVDKVYIDVNLMVPNQPGRR
jgi:uncharacterized protein